MIQLATYDPTTVFESRNTPPVKGRYKLPDGYEFRYSDRIKLFETKGVACVTCGIEGSVFVLETHDLTIHPHLNLYAVREDGKQILMTKDHIHPRSKGGADALENYDTMCSPCNGKKADKVK
jgi:5-methylcytosine-specific restriction endonuclease McrA